MRWQNGTEGAFNHRKRKCERETFGRKEEEAGQRENEKPQNRTGRRPAFEGQGERCRRGDGQVCSEGWLPPVSPPPGRAERGCSARRRVKGEICRVQEG